MNLTDVLPGTLQALRLIRATAPRGRRIPEAFYGPTAVDADLEARATAALAGVPPAQNGSPPTESGEAKNPPPQAMAKVKPIPDAVPVAAPPKPEANGAPVPPAKKTACPITRERFTKSPSAIGNKMHDGAGELQGVVALRREFSTGSLGWNANEKITIVVDGVPCKAQVGISITLVSSKELPK